MTKVDYNQMTKAEIIKHLNKLNDKVERLESTKSDSVKIQVKDLIDSGYNCIEDIAEELGKTSKNISTYLTYIRRDLKKDRKTIVSYRMNNKTYISIQPWSIFGI